MARAIALRRHKVQCRFESALAHETQASRPVPPGCPAFNSIAHGFAGPIVSTADSSGSLRLTERVYTALSHLVDRLAIGASIETCSERERRADMLERLRAFVEGLEEAAVALPNDDLLRAVDSGIIQVFAPGSRMGLREQGVLFTEERIITAAMMPMPPDNFERLMYQVECPPRYPGSPPGRRWIGADYLEATAEEGEWEYALWDTQMQVYAESLDGSGKQ